MKNVEIKKRNLTIKLVNVRPLNSCKKDLNNIKIWSIVLPSVLLVKTKILYVILVPIQNTSLLYALVRKGNTIPLKYPRDVNNVPMDAKPVMTSILINA